MLLVLLIAIAAVIIHNVKYKKTAYYQVTKNPYLSVFLDKGKYGEYQTYKNLKAYEKEGAKFLFNIYIPKGESETTEIDVLMLNSKGLFVFESKNYSGWIFGDEDRKSWYQTLPQGKGRSHKESFYNPIMQNRTHIRHLKILLGEDTPMHSIITFSERCELKNVVVKSEDIHVIKRYDVAGVVARICSQTVGERLSQDQIGALYSKLYPYTQVDDAKKAQHIANIENKLAHIPAKATAEVEKPEMIAEPIIKPVAVVEQKCEKILTCPRCGGNLVLRQAKRGANAGNRFYGCSNYPKCRYVQNLTENQMLLN